MPCNYVDITEIYLVVMWTSYPSNFSIACVRVLKIKCNVFSCISKAWKVP